MKDNLRMLAILLLAAGCSTPSGPATAPPDHEMWVSDHLRRDQVYAAARVERVVYPHHFEPHSSRLSKLGQQRVALLSSDMRETPGELVVRRGSADDALFAARLAAVRDALLAAGLGEGDFSLADGHAGGDGISSERLIGILAEDTASETGTTSVQLGGAEMEGEHHQ